jgi:long-chain fatty acid transport protein
MKSSIILVGLAFAAQMAFASGYEKSIMWGGQTSGVGGIATPYISGSTATYFNPAGLASGAAGSNDVALNVSPGWSQFKAPVLDNNTQETSTNHMAISGGLTYSRTLNEKLGVGAGYYASGGSYADYSGLTKASFPGTFEVKTDLAITEFAVGAGYKVSDDFKVGLAYRIVMAKANLSTIKQVGSGLSTTLVQANLNNLSGNNFTAFKLGAQYKVGKTDIGFTYRSDAVIHAKGTLQATGHTVAQPTVGATSEQGVIAGTDLPPAWTIGFKHACTDTFNAYGEYSFTEYSRVDNISIQTDDGKLSPPILLKMKDQHLVKIAGEYTGLMLPIRAGLLWGSQVSNADYALPTATPPGSAYVLTAGTGYGFGAFRVDGGFEYNMAKGTANQSPGGAPKGAENQVTAYALHLGGSYTF